MERTVEWGREPHDLAQKWPRLPDGTPENAAFLTDTVESDAQADLLVRMLRSYGIPVIKRYDKDGTLGKVVLGFSGYGVSLYVPASLLEDAQNLIRPVEETEDNEEEV